MKGKFFLEMEFGIIDPVIIVINYFFEEISSIWLDEGYFQDLRIGFENISFDHVTLDISVMIFSYKGLKILKIMKLQLLSHDLLFHKACFHGTTLRTFLALSHLVR